MSRERGFRRLTLAVSLVLLCTGLALTAYDIYRFIEFRNAQIHQLACLTGAGSDQKAKAECEHVSIDDYMPRHVSFGLDVLLTIAEACLSQERLISVLAFFFGPRFFLTFTICLGLAMSLVLATLPWAIFYFARWIARGFG